MVYSYRSSCLDLPVALVDIYIEGCASRLQHIYQGEYVAMNEINLVGAERNIYHNCVDKFWMGGKTEKLKKVQHSTVYRMDESEEDEE